MILLSDEEGYVLKIVGDNTIVSTAKDNILVEGCNRSERALGTNAIGTCLVLRRPIQLWAHEHYYIPHSNWTCSGSPIFDEDNNILGSLCITGTWDKVHTHTLGMVVSSAEAISKQIMMQKTYNRVFQLKGQLDTIIETLNYGVILLDKSYTVTQINSMGTSLLRIKKQDIIGSTLNKFIKDIDFLNIKSNIYDRETYIETQKANVHCTLSVISVNRDEYANSSFVITFKEIKYVHKMINRLVGSNAHFCFEDIVGESPKINEAKQLAKIASQNDSNVLLIGDSGTGKELFAQSIHNASKYSNGPFIAINCGALPRSLIESELFGYEPGTFTGAKKDGQAGKFELASGGTIFLDEIGDMPYDVQVSLLKVIQDREVIRIGGKKSIKLNVRIIAATNKNLENEIANNTFRSDLYYRLNVFNIKIPSLKERGKDIYHLTDYFFTKYKMRTNKIIKGVDKDTYDILMDYNWPGNIRELENAIERAILVAQDETIQISDLPSNIITSRHTAKDTITTYSSKSNIKEHLTIYEVEKETIKNALLLNYGNIKKTSEYLGMSRRTLYRKLEKYEIDYNLIRGLHVE